MKFKTKTGDTLLNLLMQQGGYATTSKAREVIKNGAVWLNEKQVKIPSFAVSAGAEIEINQEKSKIEARLGKYLFKVAFEDEYLIAAVKPSRVSVSKSKGNAPSFKEMVLKPILETKKNAQIFPINYVENNSSGIVLFAKDQKTQLALNEPNKYQTKFMCLLEGRVKEGEQVINAPLVVQPNLKKVLAIEKMTKLSEEAKTTFRLLKHIGRFSIVEVEGEGLKKKQLQAHFLHIKYPIAGSKKYGSKLPFKSRVGIHLYKMTFTHPVKKEAVVLEITAPQTFTRAGRYI